MNSSEKEQLIQFYQERYERLGGDIGSVGWRDEASQRLRFRILSEIADLSHCSICDVGCGFGDLCSFLGQRFEGVEYVGLDICGDLLKEAEARCPGVSFEERDILSAPVQRSFDFVLSSGALSYRIKDNKTHIKRMLEECMRMTKAGVAVNFLSSYVDYQLDKNFHFSPEEAFRIGRQLTPHVTVRHDYPLYEFTMYLYHETYVQDGRFSEGM